MGCDISLLVQGRRSDGTWECVTTSPFPNEAPDGRYATSDPRWRHYAVFRFLGWGDEAGVFAGRGVPADVGYVPPWEMTDLGDITAGDTYAADPDAGNNSHTHATLAELRAAPWADHGLENSDFAEWVRGPHLQALADTYGGPENVRVLMIFDQ